MLDDVKAYRELSDILALMLCRGLGVNLRVPVMTDPPGTATHVRESASLQVDRVCDEAEIDYGRAPDASSSNRSQPYSGAIIHTGSSGSQPYSSASIHTGANASYGSVPEASSSIRSQPHTGACIHTGRRSSVPASLVTPRGFANRSSLHTDQTDEGLQEESEVARI